LGVIQCGQNHFFPVVNGIPRLLPNAMAGAVPLLQQHLTKLPSDVRELLLNQTKTKDKNFEKYFRHTMDSFSSEWGAVRESERAWGRDVSTRRKAFLDCVGIGIEDLPGKKILDAGCGHGEVELALVKTGAEVFAMDISFSVDGVRKHLEKSEPAYASLVHIIQGNIHKLPFRQEFFDIIHSAGVLHHTPDTFRGFEI
jgi:2-polyprenyl-3-methyl-5-hydroxy-6-metoxy-1,4-benzoquinol methylase